MVLIILLGWLLLQTGVTLTGFYLVTTGTPPRFALLLLPPAITIVALILTRKGRLFLDQSDARALALLHTVRLPVELVLYGLFIHHAVPLLMTFKGRNWDILSGLTAPLIWFLYFRKGWLTKWVLLVWNVICLVLLINIAATAILSSPFVFQQFGFEQPNIALSHFPYSWLPALVVPLVLLAHVAVLRQILTGKLNKPAL